MRLIQSCLMLCFAGPMLFSAGCAAPPHAPGSLQTLRRATPAGIGVRVASYARWNERCEQAGLPMATVTRDPPHGTLSVRPAAVTVGSRRFAGSTDCRDKQIAGTELFYTPNPGFRGTDPMEYRVTEDQTTLTFTATVDVR